MVYKEAWILSWDLLRKSLVVRCTYQNAFVSIYAGCTSLVLSSLAVVCHAHLYFQNVVSFLLCDLPGVCLLVKVTCLTAATQAGHAVV